MDDSTAIMSCRRGDADSFRHLVERYQKQAVGHAIAILGNREDALDAVQDSFVRAFQALNRFDLGMRFYPWFYTILRHQCFKLVAQRHKRMEVNADDLQLLSPSAGPANNQTILLEQALLALDAEQRELITLRHLDGLSYQDLAERLEIPIGTVMSRLYHARRKLREKLSSRSQMVLER